MGPTWVGCGQVGTGSPPWGPSETHKVKLSLHQYQNVIEIKTIGLICYESVKIQ